MTHAELSRETQLQAWSLLRQYGYTLDEIRRCVGWFDADWEAIREWQQQREKKRRAVIMAAVHGNAKERRNDKTRKTRPDS